MIATITFVRQKFDEFNRLCFCGSLPPIELKIGSARKMLGSFRYPLRYPSLAKRGVGECRITISNRFDRPQDFIEDTLIHEMIHYWVWLQRIDDEPAHGPAFRRMMKDINTRFGRNITVRTAVSEDFSNSDTHFAHHYICITHWKNGRLGLTLAARPRIFEINRIWSADTRVDHIEWFYSTDPWFNRFPTSRTAKAYVIDSTDYATRISTQLPCEIRGPRFQPIRP